MKGGFEIKLEGLPPIKSSEHGYQASKFMIGADVEEIQKDILAQKSATSAKMKAKGNGAQELWLPSMLNLRKNFRNIDPSKWTSQEWEDAHEVINIMWYWIVLKLVNNRITFGKKLINHGGVSGGDIIEIAPMQSKGKADLFWGTKIEENEAGKFQLVGLNVMGKLLTRLRDLYISELRMNREIEDEEKYFPLLEVVPPYKMKIGGKNLVGLNYNTRKHLAAS